ncbi:MAG TPA: 50S ribosomal protein L10 [Planctomycetes bacterium]|nr:50S ribosomal protein L10 [Planctomycetota bacterium]
MPNIINKIILRDLTSTFENSEGLLFVSLDGLTVAESEGLRNALAESGLTLRMIRNRLATIALKERGLEPPEGFFAGNIGCCWGDAEDTVTAAKVLHTSPERKAGKVALRGGVFEGEFLGEKEAVALASLPTKDEMRAKILGTLQAPAQNLVGLINAPGGALARVLQARVDKDQS